MKSFDSKMREKCVLAVVDDEHGIIAAEPGFAVCRQLTG